MRCVILFQDQMGTCFSGTKETEGNNKTAAPKIGRKDQKTFESTTELNQQFLQQTFTKTEPTSIPTSALETESKIKSIISLEDALQKSNIDAEEGEEIKDLQSWIESHNTTSSIIKIPKNKRKSQLHAQSSQKKRSKVFSEIDCYQNMDGALQTDRHVAKIIITNDTLDIQFMLPRSRAGPLVVPYINYQKYPAR